MKINIMRCFHMKQIISALVILVLSFSASAEGTQDKESLEVCKELAVEQELSSDNAKKYIEQCAKFIAEDEGREKQEELTSKEKS